MSKKMYPVYDGQSIENLTKQDVINNILKEYKVISDESIIHSMEEAFRCGFLCGEEYGRNDGQTVQSNIEEGLRN